MRNFFSGLLILSFLAALGVGSPLGARPKVHKKKAENAAKKESSDSPDELNPAGEDETGEGTNKFKEDSDDTYEDDSADENNSYRSKFKEDQDKDDSEKDSSDQEDS